MSCYYHPLERAYQPCLEPLVNARMVVSLAGHDPSLVEFIRAVYRVGDELKVPLYCSDLLEGECRILHVHYGWQMSALHMDCVASICHEAARRLQFRVENRTTYWREAPRLREPRHMVVEVPVATSEEEARYFARHEMVYDDDVLRHHINRARYQDADERKADAQWKGKGEG